LRAGGEQIILVWILEKLF